MSPVNHSTKPAQDSTIHIIDVNQNAAPNVLTATKQKDTPTAISSPVDGGTTPSKVKGIVLHEKLFKIRESYLTELFENKHIATVYNLCWLTLFYLAAHTICHDYAESGRVYFGALTFQAGFAGIHYAFGCWCLLHLILFGLFYGFKLWTCTYTSRMKGLLGFLLNMPWLLLYIAALVLVLYIPIKCCLTLDLPFPSAAALLLETARLLMKLHAYVRTSAAKWLRATQDHTSDSDERRLPHFTAFLYFLFAPTLIFRTSYPRTTAPIRWRFVGARLLEAIGATFIFCFIYEHSIRPYYADFGQTPLNMPQIMEHIFGMILPATFMFVTVFFQVLHAVQNFFAELLHFGDRVFYKSWWTVKDYRGYHCDWNCLVQDWLYEYIYKDVATYVCRSRPIIAFVIFSISALMHELIIGFSLQLFFPVNFMLFGVINYLLMTIHLPGRWGNIFLWATLLLGNSLQFSLYSMEYFAKQNCPNKQIERFSDYLVPHIWNCYLKYK